MRSRGRSAHRDATSSRIGVACLVVLCKKSRRDSEYHPNDHGKQRSAKQGEDGRWHFRYDPGIAQNFHAAPLADVDLRPYWSQVHGPVLVIRGEHSDLLLAETLEEMRQRPRTESLIVPDTGHCPMLMDEAQVGAVRRFLLG